jgi:anthranilate/para-aminobenzoate synthase component II/molybdopterin-guanine dinucleotide biosynthesis protein A
MRDNFEEQLFSAAVEHGAAILGVCRGCQFLAARFGATLRPCVGHVATHHTVKFSKNAAPYNEFKEWSECYPSMKVNSYHSFGIENSNEMNHLEPLLFSDDGNIEGLQGTVEHSRVFGIMCHPERSEGMLKNADVQFVKSVFGLSGRPRKTTTKAIVLCAGQGSRLKPLTNKVPKCMVKYKNHCIIDFILASLRKVGVEDICLAKGYLASALARKDTSSIVNKAYVSTNMVATLFCAEEAFQSGDDVIVSYSDIIFSPEISQTLISNTADIAVVIDRQWRALWEARVQNPLSDAETLKIDDAGFITEIGPYCKA